MGVLRAVGAAEVQIARICGKTSPGGMLGRWAVHRPNCRFATKKLARVRRFDSGPSEPIVFLNKAGTRHHGQPRVFGNSRIDSGFVAAYDAYADPHGADDGTRRAPGGAAEARPHRTGI